MKYRVIAQLLTIGLAQDFPLIDDQSQLHVNHNATHEYTNQVIDLVEQNRALTEKIKELQEQRGKEDEVEKADVNTTYGLGYLILSIIKNLVFLAIWFALLPFRIVLWVIWYFFASIIRFLWRSFYNGILKYGLATIVFISGAIAIIKYDARVRKYIEKHKNA